jgi:hypothetical protein
MIGLPAVFYPELKKLLTAAGVGFAAETIVARFFLVQYWCGSIALVHLLAEWMYCGRPVRRLNLGLIIGLLALALAGGLWAQPKMKTLHEIKYFGKTADLQAQAGKSFAMWHGISETINIFVIGSLVLYLWSVSAPPESARFSKIRANS